MSGVGSPGVPGVDVRGKSLVPAGSDWVVPGDGLEIGGSGSTSNINATPAIVTTAARNIDRLVRRRHARLIPSVNGRSNHAMTRRFRRVRGSARSAHVEHEARCAGASSIA